jgi:hypothetical protein
LPELSFADDACHCDGKPVSERLQCIIDCKPTTVPKPPHGGTVQTPIDKGS